MIHNLGIIAIPAVHGMSNYHDGPTERPMAPDNGKKGGGLARKHGTEEKFKAHFGVCCSESSGVFKDPADAPPQLFHRPA
jgi:hypothetical protein